MIIGQVRRAVLIRNQVRHARKKKVVIVRAVNPVNRILGQAQRRDCAHRFFNDAAQLFAPVQEKSVGAARAYVVGDHCDVTVKLCSVTLDITCGAEHSLLLSSEERKADRASWREAELLSPARNINHSSRIHTVILRARSQFPRIKMRADENYLVRPLAPPNLRYDVARLVRAADSVDEIEPDSHIAPDCESR